MKKSVLFLALALSSSAMASQLPNPLLQFTQSRGAVAPAFQVITKCQVYDASVVISTYGPAVRGTQTSKKVAWTNDVPNAQIVRALVQAAKRGPFAPKSLPVGGPTKTYNGVETVGAGAPSYVELSTPTAHNGSKAAKTLIEFLDFNCLAQ